LILSQFNRVLHYLQTSLKLRIYTAANCETVAIRWQLINWLIALTNVNRYGALLNRVRRTRNRKMHCFCEITISLNVTIFNLQRDMEKRHLSLV